MPALRVRQLDRLPLPVSSFDLAAFGTVGLMMLVYWPPAVILGGLVAALMWYLDDLAYRRGRRDR